MSLSDPTAQPTSSPAQSEQGEDAVHILSTVYLERFGHYPPIHRMPDDLALESIRGALKDDQPLPPEPFSGSGCNCA